ncbi:MAG: winged helix-turn-helix domain-containing protein [Bryobacteraceae bacterium]
MAKQSALSRSASAHASASAGPLREVGGHGADAGAPALDRLIHERMRLGIVSALAVNQTLTFNDLKKLLGTTDGNLSVHARKLEEAGYIACTKYFDGRLPKTEYRLSAQGRYALERYLDHMEALIRAMRER